MKYTYLLIDLFSVLFPFAFSFHPKLKFYKNWFAFFPAVCISGLIFIFWDMYFTHLKVWGFNPDYLTGIYVGNLPVEEVLFFFCIPYACVFTYACLPLKDSSKSITRWLSALLIAGSLVMSVVFHRYAYTLSTFIVLAILITLAQFVLKVGWLLRFYQTYLVLLVPFMLVNGPLTGTGLAAPVVWYNPAQMMSLRILTIPFEDIFYGMALILLNLLIYNAIGASRLSPRPVL